MYQSATEVYQAIDEQVEAGRRHDIFKELKAPYKRALMSLHLQGKLGSCGSMSMGARVTMMQWFTEKQLLDKRTLAITKRGQAILDMIHGQTFNA